MGSSTDVPNKVLLRVDEVAAIFRVSQQSIYNWVANGTLPCVRRLGQPIRFRRETIMELIKEEDE